MNALLLGYYGANNLGDDMMLYCLTKWLEKQNVKISVISENSALTYRQCGHHAITNAPICGQWGLRSIKVRGEALRLVAEIFSHDCLIVGGGDLIRDDRGWKTFSYTLEKMVIALFFFKPIYLVNVGIGNPTTVWGKLILKFVLRRCRSIIVRDERSERLCKSLSCGNQVKLLPDIVFNLPSMMPQPDCSHDRNAKERAYVVVCLRSRPNLYGQFPFGDKEAYVLAKALEAVIEQGLEILFVPFQLDSEDNDNKTHEMVMRHMVSKNHIHLEKWTGDLAKTISLLRHAKLVVAMRLHAGVVAVSFGRNCVLLPYDHKVRELASSCGISHLITNEILASEKETYEVLNQALNEPTVYAKRNMQTGWQEAILLPPKI